MTTTNAIESLISIARTTTGHVKNWRDGEMRRRWCAAGMLEGERFFRRIKGHRELPAFTKKIRAHINQKTGTGARTATGQPDLVPSVTAPAPYPTVLSGVAGG